MEILGLSYVVRVTFIKLNDTEILSLYLQHKRLTIIQHKNMKSWLN